MNHLEQLISEWLEYKGYFVRRNVKVGKLSHGGHEGEVDIAAFHPETNHLLHVEPSIDAHPWDKREARFLKKFKSGKKYIISEIFPWLPKSTKIEQWAVLWASDKNYQVIGGGKIIPIWNLYQIIAKDISSRKAPGNAISEQYSLLRTMQFTLHWVINNNGN